jgi:GAF domain-containing protein
MLARFRNFLRPPAFEDPEKNVQAKNLNAILRALLLLTLIYLFYAIFTPPLGQVIVAAAALAVEIVILALARTGRTRQASILVVSMLWLAIFVEEIMYGGVRDSGFAAFTIVIVIAGLTLGMWGGILYTVLTIAGGAGLIYAENLGLLPPYPYVAASSVLVSHTITFVAVLLLLYLAVQSVAVASRRIAKDEQATRAINLQLAQSQSDLEQRSSALEQRNRALQTVAEVGSLIGQNHEENEFLRQAARLLGEHLSFDRVRIFLLDEAGECLLLRASNLEEEEKEEQRIWITRGGSAHGTSAEIITFHIGKETFQVPLPEAADGTLLNAVFPLQTGARFIGIISIQSAAAKMGAVERASLQAIADQVANALDNARLSTQLQNRLREIELLTGRSAQEAWKKVEAGTQVGFEYDRIRVLPGGEQYPPEITSQLLEGKSVTYVTTGKKQAAKLASPILLRGQVIGVIGYDEEDPQHVWENDRIIVLESVAAQVGMALENTRLIADAQQRAQQEQLIGEVTSNMRATLDMDTVLQTAIREMRRSFGLKEAEIRLQAAPAGKISEKSKP